LAPSWATAEVAGEGHRARPLPPWGSLLRSPAPQGKSTHTVQLVHAARPLRVTTAIELLRVARPHRRCHPCHIKSQPPSSPPRTEPRTRHGRPPIDATTCSPLPPRLEPRAMVATRPLVPSPAWDEKLWRQLVAGAGMELRWGMAARGLGRRQCERGDWWRQQGVGSDGGGCSNREGGGW
jgi:hypothetical protein